VKRNLVFHAGCPDGFGAAWAAWRAWGDSGRYIARGHEDPFEALRFDGELVVFADISLKNDKLLELSEVAAQIVILDHHLTARDHFHSDPAIGAALDEAGHVAHFDLSHSGAVLSWQYFHPDEPPPELLRYVEDQDLWNWKLPHSEDVNAAIGSYVREFEVWNELAARGCEDLAREGEPIVRANRIEVQRALNHAHPVAIGTERIEAVNSVSNRAAIGHELAKRARFDKPWGLVYRTSGTHTDCSIYSTGDLDVSAIAARYGGGGHRNASGFSIPLATWVSDFA
jgi:oligoribonuclease NrnB/cAMP/cGMP phosphodiesterase (DHH superfamily)